MVSGGRRGRGGVVIQTLHFLCIVVKDVQGYWFTLAFSRRFNSFRRDPYPHPHTVAQHQRRHIPLSAAPVCLTDPPLLVVPPVPRQVCWPGPLSGQLTGDAVSLLLLAAAGVRRVVHSVRPRAAVVGRVDHGAAAGGSCCWCICVLFILPRCGDQQSMHITGPEGKALVTVDDP